MNISVKPFKGVHVAVPDGLSFKQAEEFVNAKTDWIQGHLYRMKQYEEENKIISDASVDIDRAKAKRKLTRRLKYLAGKHGLTYNRVFIRNQKTRWGSCSHKNNISLKELGIYIVHIVPDDAITILKTAIVLPARGYI